jgi:HTH-type transcriptional regulator / antitoxin HipB
VKACATSHIFVLFGLQHKSDLLLKTHIDTICVSAHTTTMKALARNSKQIGNIIRSARKRLNMTQADLGEKTALRQETISTIETGTSSARIDSLLAVLAALDLEFHIAPRASAWGNDEEGTP